MLLKRYLNLLFLILVLNQVFAQNSNQQAQEQNESLCSQYENEYDDQQQIINQKCIQCSDDTKQPPYCLCNEKQFYDQELESCESCPENCVQCSNKDSCEVEEINDQQEENKQESYDDSYTFSRFWEDSKYLWIVLGTIVFLLLLYNFIRLIVNKYRKSHGVQDIAALEQEQIKNKQKQQTLNLQKQLQQRIKNQHLKMDASFGATVPMSNQHIPAPAADQIPFSHNTQTSIQIQDSQKLIKLSPKELPVPTKKNVTNKKLCSQGGIFIGDVDIERNENIYNKKNQHYNIASNNKINYHY